MKQNIYALGVAILLFTNLLLNGQTTFPINDVEHEYSGVHAFTNATIVTQAGTTLENATMVVSDGKITAIGSAVASSGKKGSSGVSVPEGATVHDCSGLFIYPSFIDPFTDYGLPEVKPKKRESRNEQMVSEKDGAYGWNECLIPEFDAAKNFSNNDEAAEKLRAAGYGTVFTHRRDGVARGTGAVVLLGDERENEQFLKQRAAAVYSFRKGSSSQSYPSSLMGAIALLRQTYMDGKWYSGQRDELNLSLEAWNNNQSLPQFFEVDDHLSILRADKVGDEFGKQYIIKSNGAEYRRIDAIKATNANLIVSVNFPEAYDLTDPFSADLVSLGDMKHWEMAPSNPAVLEKSGITYALTAHGLEGVDKMMPAIRKAIEHGLSEAAALKAMTETPAMLLGVADQVGKLENGKRANFILCSGPLFEKDSKILQNWVAGKAFKLEDMTVTSVDGDFDLKLGSKTYKLSVQQGKDLSVKKDSTDLKAKGSISRSGISLQFKDGDELYRLSGWRASNGGFKGRCQDAAGKWSDWTANTATATGQDETDGKTDADSEDEIARKAEAKEMGSVCYPFTPYGWMEKPKQEDVLFKNATVWTNEADGILENTDVLIAAGKIVKVGKDLSSKNAKVVDATGMHLTTGIIDEHSHIAIFRGVNEGTQAVTAEVSIADVVNSDDVNIYRQLGGGVTASQLLHGSANPIGGRSALIKMRWGSTPDEMQIKGADGFIKFALGENVKQSNWGDDRQTRFPQTRMGVEQVFMDAFNRAKNYNPVERRDIELEVLSEIMQSKRFVTCHSYVQSEINMLMKVAEANGFRINTFTHILEGYKLADKMVEHGVGGSTFSDWWAYKYEVIDAIPYNAAIMQKAGVVTALNSDDAEMGRRLNQEAGKAVKYGGVSEEEAWKMVTLNPAKLLHLDNRMGSIKTGMDADLVLWTDNPLSIYAKASSTYVDGICYFSLTEDLAIRKEISTERMRLINKMLADDSDNKRSPKHKEEKHYHCDDVADECAGF